MMAAIRGKDTQPEIYVRKALHRIGFRYKVHDQTLPGKPDLVFPKFKAVILVNGCFWHQHDCHLFKWPTTRSKFWREKIQKNKERDKENQIKLEERGWKVLTIWECALKGKEKMAGAEVVNTISAWLINDPSSAEIRGRKSIKSHH